MCLAVPNKVIKIKNKQAVVRSGLHSHKVSLDLVKNVKVGDYLIIHGDLALHKITIPEAKKILKMIKKAKK